MLLDKQTYIENDHPQKWKNKLPKTTWIKRLKFTILSWLAFNSAFDANVPTFVFKLEFFTRHQISDVLTNSFCFIFTLAMLLVNLL